MSLMWVGGGRWLYGYHITTMNTNMPSITIGISGVHMGRLLAEEYNRRWRKDIVYIEDQGGDYCVELAPSDGSIDHPLVFVE